MKVDVLTLFPEMITSYCGESILGIASRSGLIDVRAHNPRDYATDRYKSVDDTSYGGGAGMLLAPAPYYACVQDRLKDWSLGLDVYAPDFTHASERDYEVIITSPRGRVLDQQLAVDLSKRKRLMIICGRYEGFDERIMRLATMQVSLGDFVLTGGELAALAIIDSSARLIQGVLGDDTSSHEESFSRRDYVAEFARLGVTKREAAEFLERVGLKSLDEIGLLKEYPQYTKPAEFHGMRVPEILESGNHKLIYLWRLEQALKLTRERALRHCEEHSDEA